MAHANPYPPAPPPEPPPAARSRLTFDEAWKRVLSLAGLVGVALLVMRPDLRSIEAWLVTGGAAGILPIDRVLERFGIGSAR